MELDADVTMTSSSLNCTTTLTSDPHSSSAGAVFSDADNGTNVTSGVRPEDDQFIDIRVICEVWISIPIAVAGIIGNILSLIVLCHHKQILTTTLVLQALAIADTMVLVLTLLLRSFRYVGIPGYDEMLPYVFPWAFPTMYQIRLVDTWLTVLLTVDRYIAVCHPLHAQHLCTIRRTYVIIIVTVAAVTLFCVPRYFEYERVDLSVARTGFRPTALMANQAYAIGYCIIMFFVVMYLVPMTILTVLNGWILVALRRSQAMRSATLGFHQGASTASGVSSARHTGNGSSSAATRTVTLIAMTIVLICIVCNVMAMVAHIIYSLQTAFREELGFLEHYRRHLANYSNILITLNSAINFVVYCAFSRKFRNVFVRVFFRRRPHSKGCCCFGCCGHASRHRLDHDACSDSVLRQSSADRFSQTTKRVSMSSIRSVIKRDAIYNGDREAQMLCESSVL